MRGLISGLIVLALMRGPLADGKDPAPAPFRVLFSNDTTNILTTPTPYKPRPGPFKEEYLRASVDETAGLGIEVHLLQPGLGWVPLWQSKFLPVKEHLSWQKKFAARDADAFEQYVADGGDVVRVFIEECRRKALVPFVSLRLNDGHNIFHASVAADGVDRETARATYQFYADHPQYRLGPEADQDPNVQYMLDWAHPEVREYKLGLIRELAAYELAGLELDFMRHPVFFNPKRTNSAARRKIMKQFVAEVRQVLNRNAKPGEHRWLCVRLPGYPELYDRMGINLKDFATAGVDMVNVSGYYFTDFQLEIGKIRRQLPRQVALYAELQFAAAVAAETDPKGKKVQTFARTTPAELYTAAHLAYVRGATGVSAFNFQYYRGTYNPDDVYGPAAEPPWQVFAHLGDPAWLARQQNQSYLVGRLWDDPERVGRPFQKPLSSGESATVELDMAPPTGGWKRGGTLRLRAATPLGAGYWQVNFNGTILKQQDPSSRPSGAPHPTGLGRGEDHDLWEVPLRLLRIGNNKIAIKLRKGGPMQLVSLNVEVE